MARDARTGCAYAQSLFVSVAIVAPAMLALSGCQRVVVNPAGPAPAAAPAAAVPAPVAAAPVAAPAMPPLPPRPVRAPTLVGSWQGVAPNMAASITIAPNGLFAEDEVTSGVRVLIHGHIIHAGPGLVTLVAENWAPAALRLQHAVTYRETWLAPNRVVMTGNGGSITLTRVG